MLGETNFSIFIVDLATIFLDFLLGFVLLAKTLRLEQGPPRRYYTGLYSFFFVHAICRTLFLTRSYFIESSLTMERSVMFDIGTMLGLLSVLLLVVAFLMNEKLAYENAHPSVGWK